MIFELWLQVTKHLRFPLVREWCPVANFDYERGADGPDYLSQLDPEKHVSRVEFLSQLSPNQLTHVFDTQRFC